MKNSIKILISLALAVVGSQAQALTIDGTALTVDTCTTDPLCYYGPSGSPASNPSTADIETAITYQGGETVSLSEVYKEDVDDGFDTGSFAGSYETTFSNTATDPNDATINWVTGTQSLLCGDCFLLVKGGIQDAPLANWYVFDISSWDGTSEIVLQNFWVDTGAISHVTIFDGGTNIPEPGMVALLSIGLIGMVVARRRMKL